MERVTDYLRADHARLTALLRTAAGGPVLDADAYDQFRRGLLRHIAIEEKILLPAARRARGGEPIGRAHALRVDHAALGSLLVPTPDHALCAELASIIEPHDVVEEGAGGVYEECEALIGGAASAELAVAARSFGPVRAAAHFDGQGVVRTAEAALASAARLAPPARRS